MNETHTITVWARTGPVASAGQSTLSTLSSYYDVQARLAIRMASDDVGERLLSAGNTQSPASSLPATGRRTHQGGDAVSQVKEPKIRCLSKAEVERCYICI